MTPQPTIRDTRLQTVELFDLLDTRIATLQIHPALPGEGLRTVIFKGRAFVEQDGTGYYKAGQFVEQQAAAI